MKTSDMMDYVETISEDGKKEMIMAFQDDLHRVLSHRMEDLSDDEQLVGIYSFCVAAIMQAATLFAEVNEDEALEPIYNRMFEATVILVRSDGFEEFKHDYYSATRH